MPKPTVVLLLTALTLGLGGCAHQHHRHLNQQHVHHQQHQLYYHHRYYPAAHRHLEHHYAHYLQDNLLQPEAPPVSTAQPLPGWSPPANSYRPAYTHKLLGDYAEQMTMKLVENMRYVTVNTPVAVASFVDLASDLGRTNILGNQLAESFITELQEYGIPVMDYKTTGAIHVGKNGDFAFSRDLSELTQNPRVNYVLSGTMTYNDRGVILNVRMVDLKTKVVVASTKGFVPSFIVDSLYPGRLQQGLMVDVTT